MNISNELQKELDLLMSWNKAYRYGNAIVSDERYDKLETKVKSQLPKDHPFLVQIGYVPEKRKQYLPVAMFSLDKFKTFKEYLKWIKLKKISSETTVILSPKLDGISILQDESTKVKESWTRGDGVIGSESTAWLKKSGKNSDLLVDAYSYGEMIFLRKNFQKYAEIRDDEGNIIQEGYANGRNTVAGKFNADEPEDILKDIEYIRYGIYDKGIENKFSKQEELDLANSLNQIKMPYQLVKISEITEELIKGLFAEWKADYDIDGVVLDINDYKLRKKLGREINHNPAYAKALKFSFEDVGTSRIESVDLQVSKNGELFPTGNINPIRLSGTEVKRVNLYNAKMMLDNGIMDVSLDILDSIKSLTIKKSKIDLIKSGEIIPKPINYYPTEEDEIITVTCCPECGSLLKWNESGIHICCSNPNCSGIIKKELVRAFEILKYKNMGDSTIEKLVDNGFNSLESILTASDEDLLAINGFGKKFVENLSKLKKSLLEIGLPLNTLMHISNKFDNLGSKKLLLILKNIDDLNNIDKDALLKVKGLQQTSVDSFIKGLENYTEWVEKMPIKILPIEKDTVNSNKYSEYKVCFTGIRDKELEDKLKENGASIVGSVSKKLTHLIVKDINEDLSKIKKAKDLNSKGNSIIITSLEDFKNNLDK